MQVKRVDIDFEEFNRRHNGFLVNYTMGLIVNASEACGNWLKNLTDVIMDCFVNGVYLLLLNDVFSHYPYASFAFTIKTIV